MRLGKPMLRHFRRLTLTLSPHGMAISTHSAGLFSSLAFGRGRQCFITKPQRQINSVLNFSVADEFLTLPMYLT